MPQQIVIDLDEANLAALKAEGHVLYVTKGFETTSAQGKPLVWLETGALGNRTTITVVDQYSAYIAMEAQAVELGDIVTLEDGEVLTRSPGGHPRGVTFRNTTPESQAAGLAVGVNGQDSPAFEMPLEGLSEEIVVPLGMLLLTFSTAGVKRGDPLRYSMTQSLLVRMSGLQLAAAFDVNSGWSFDAAPWFRTVPAGEDLFAVLAKQSPLTQPA